MARECDGCKRLIRQRGDEFLELQIHVLDTTENEDQDADSQAHGDFCDECIGSGVALANLLERVDWKLGRRAVNEG